MLQRRPCGGGVQPAGLLGEDVFAGAGELFQRGGGAVVGEADDRAVEEVRALGEEFRDGVEARHGGETLLEAGEAAGELRDERGDGDFVREVQQRLAPRRPVRMVNADERDAERLAHGAKFKVRGAKFKVQKGLTTDGHG